MCFRYWEDSDYRYWSTIRTQHARCIRIRYSSAWMYVMHIIHLRAYNNNTECIKYTETKIFLGFLSHLWQICVQYRTQWNGKKGRHLMELTVAKKRGKFMSLINHLSLLDFFFNVWGKFWYCISVFPFIITSMPQCYEREYFIFGIFLVYCVHLIT